MRSDSRRASRAGAAWGTSIASIASLYRHAEPNPCAHLRAGLDSQVSAHEQRTLAHAAQAEAAAGLVEGESLHRATVACAPGSVHKAQHGDNKGVYRWVMVTILLGLVFLVITLVVEWPEKLHEFTPTTNVYGSLYFTITGFHLAHVVVGLLMSVWTQVRAWGGAFGRDRHVTVQNFTMYWHFVDVVWGFVFVTIYLSPNL